MIIYDEPEDLVRAYLWYSLSETTNSQRRRDELPPKITAEHIIEAERLVVEWQPNPTECEAIFRQLEKYAQSVGARHEQLEALARLGNAAALYRHAYSLNDFSQSWKWYCLAANQGHGIASYAVGNFYRSGLGPVKQDRIKAYVWYTLAGDAGTARSVGAAPSKDKLASEMTPSQIAEAERLVAEWEPNPAECEAIAAQIEN
ncbi:MAG: hypothetical protein V3T76_08810 [candidate division NC10 bacterium]